MSPIYYVKKYSVHGSAPKTVQRRSPTQVLTWPSVE